jgi:hypothetical protein
MEASIFDRDPFRRTRRSTDVSRIATFALAAGIVWPSIVGGDARAQESKPAPAGQPAAPAPATPGLDLAEVKKKIYDPTEAGLKSLSFAFVHPAFAIAPSTSKTSFRCEWKAGGAPQIVPVDLTPEYDAMTTQFTQIFDYVWRFGGPQTILREAAERAEAAPDGVSVRLVAKDLRHSWTLRFKDVGGKLLLSGATSPEYGSIALEYAEVKGFQLVSKLTVDDPKRPIGKFTIECRDVKVE